MKNNVKFLYENGQKSLGTFFETGSATAVQCLALSGFDYIIIDLEHGPFNPDSALQYVRAAKQYGTVPFARVQSATRPDILKLLDIGAMGLIIPAVKTVSEVEKIVEYGKYSPIGNRGLAGGSGADFWMTECAEMGIPAYMAHVNQETMLIPQCETKECLDNLENIVSVPGVDGIFVGPMDLSCALGIPAQFDNPIYKEALQHIQRVCAEKGKFAMLFALNLEAAKAGFDMGYDSITYSMDALIFARAGKSIVQKVMQK